MLEIMYFFNDTANTEIYTLSLHDALPISELLRRTEVDLACDTRVDSLNMVNITVDLEDALGITVEQGELTPERVRSLDAFAQRSEEHTSELQSRQYLVCRLLLEKIIYKRL